MIFIIDLLIAWKKIMNRIILFNYETAKENDKSKYTEILYILKIVKQLLITMFIIAIVFIIIQLLPIK